MYDIVVYTYTYDVYLLWSCCRSLPPSWSAARSRMYYIDSTTLIVLHINLSTMIIIINIDSTTLIVLMSINDIVPPSWSAARSRRVEELSYISVLLLLLSSLVVVVVVVVVDIIYSLSFISCYLSLPVLLISK